MQKGTAKTTGWSRTQHWLPRLIATVNKYNHAGEVFLNGSYSRARHRRADLLSVSHSFKTEKSGTKSFRFSVSKPPLQQMPKNDPEIGPLIREVLSARSKMRLRSPLIFHSRSFASSRTMAWCTKKLPGAEEAAEIYRNNPNADFHQMVADITGLGRRVEQKPSISANIYGCRRSNYWPRQMGKTLAETRAM